MSCPINQDSLEKLKQFIGICKANPAILHLPDLAFLKEFIESLGGSVPEPKKMSTEAPTEKPKENTEEAVESDPESELDLDMTGCVEPDKLEDSQKMGDDSIVELTEEASDLADEKRRAGVSEFNAGNYEKAIEFYTEAIEINPLSALLFAKRGQVYLKLTKPNACIKDCTKALELNCDSAAAYKFRGRAYRLLGEWELAAKDLRQAGNIDLDEETDEWLREVTPNAKKIELHNLKQERKKLEKEERDKMERIRKAKEAHAKAAQPASEGQDIPSPPGGMSDFYSMLQDPEVLAAFQDPEVAEAFQDITANPANFMKYQSNPKISALITKLSNKFKGSGMPNFSGMPGFMGGAPPSGGGNPPPSFKQDDDHLD